MKELVAFLAMFVTLGGVAHAREPRATSWTAVERLRPGTMVVVEQQATVGDYRYQTPCEVIGVNDDSLTCRPKDARSGRVVYPASEVLTVYRVKTRITTWSWVRTGLLGGAGFLVGCAITDDQPDYPLGGMGAAAGALYGLDHLSRKRHFEVIYWQAASPR